MRPYKMKTWEIVTVVAMFVGIVFFIAWGMSQRPGGPLSSGVIWSLLGALAGGIAIYLRNRKRPKSD